MIVWFEGADGSGKTTLVDSLLDYGYTSIPSPARIKNKDIELKNMRSVVDAGRLSDKTVLIDRGPMTEFVYRLVDNCESYLDSVERYLQLISNSKIVYCYSRNAFANAMKRGEDNIVDVAVHRQIVNAYEHHLNMLKKFYKDVQICWYNWEIHDFMDVLRFINN